ncbi:RtcB family protein [Dethiosulfatarculus sandiegensis]|nr:RtcB family protein [Dethiosulfatarculus sandiegensis]
MKQNSPHEWVIKTDAQGKIRAVLIADQQIIDSIKQDGTLKQLSSVAWLPGICEPALAMPDAHQGYGFPIGGVAAFYPETGVISPGGVGYDINCGVRLYRTNLDIQEIKSQQLKLLADALFQNIPAGYGHGKGLKLNQKDLNMVFLKGSAWPISQGMGEISEIDYSEANGRLSPADPEKVSERAKTRGITQLGTLGGGNHFLELARVDEIYQKEAAGAMGLKKGQIVLWLHSGSRGLGHQVCDDYLRLFGSSPEAIHQKDRQLISAPINSRIGQDYLAALGAAANFAFANRQVLAWLARETIQQSLKIGPRDLGLSLVYDVAHNIAKLETHNISGRPTRLLVHRKGATRALGPGHPELPAQYQAVGQPVLLPGDMGRASFVLVGSRKAQEKTFASSAHGAGRRLSRTQAKKLAKNRNLIQELLQSGVQVRCQNPKSLAEEMPQAYKDVHIVAKILDETGIAPMVAKTVPLLVIKG